MIQNVNDCIRVVQLCESDCNIKAAWIYELFYKEYKLLRDPNHQNVAFFIMMAEQFCKDINVTIDSTEEGLYKIPYFHSDVPIYPSVYRHLGLNWVNESTKYEVFFNSGIKILSFQEYILAYYDYASTVKHIREIC